MSLCLHTSHLGHKTCIVALLHPVCKEKFATTCLCSLHRCRAKIFYSDLCNLLFSNLFLPCWIGMLVFYLLSSAASSSSSLFGQGSDIIFLFLPRYYVVLLIIVTCVGQMLGKRYFDTHFDFQQQLQHCNMPVFSLC